MHEYSITSSIVNIVEDIRKKNNLKKISKVNFELNPLANIEPDSIRFYYEYMTSDKKTLKDAQLIFNIVKLEIKCKDCSNLFEREEFIPVCPRCGSSRVNISDADDIKIISVET